jgi:purine-binding chemotaxis protein CheW
MVQSSSNTLAAPAANRPTAEAERVSQYLTFTLGHDLFAIAIQHIKEIIEFGGLTEIPMMPPFLRGVLNLRGAMVPVIDLTERFTHERTTIGKRTCVVILELENEQAVQLMGILVDSVNEVLAVEQHAIEARPSFGARIRSDFIEGMINLNGHFVIALDIEQVLSLDELTQMIELAVSGDGLSEAMAGEQVAG